jgi:hypothetical protein
VVLPSSGNVSNSCRLQCSGSGPPQLQALSSDASRYINNALTDLKTYLSNPSASCTANVINKLHAGRNFYSGDFVRYLLNGTHFYDGKYCTVPIKGVIVPVDPDHRYYDTIKQEFRQDHHVIRGDGQAVTYRTMALTSALSPQLLVFFSRDAIHDSNSGKNSGNYALLFHEGLHGYGAFTRVNYYDDDLKLMFGLPMYSATDVISNYIQTNCF